MPEEVLITPHFEGENKTFIRRTPLLWGKLKGTQNMSDLTFPTTGEKNGNLVGKEWLE